MISLQHIEKCYETLAGRFVAMHDFDLAMDRCEFRRRGWEVWLWQINPARYEGLHRLSAEIRRRETMDRIRLLAIGITLMFAPAMLAQQTATQPAGRANRAAQGGDLPNVEQQLKVLTQKLDLIGDQQARIKTILQELHDATRKLMQDESMSHEELLGKVRPLRMNANKKIREILNDDQKKKLDLYLQGPHSEMHGNLHGATPPATRKP